MTRYFWNNKIPRLKNFPTDVTLKVKKKIKIKDF